MSRKYFDGGKTTFRSLGHFLGTELSEFDKKSGFISYKTLADTMGSTVLCNNIVNHFELELEQGNDYDEENDYYKDIYQYFIIDNSGARILEEYAPDEIVYYCNELDIYVWGIGHYGTSWTIVPTSISIDEEI